MLLAHPEEICTTAQEVLDRGMPKNPMDASTPQELVYQNFSLAGGQCKVYGGNHNIVNYTFADNTSVFFAFECIASEQYRLKAVSTPPDNEPPIIRDKNEVDMLKAGNQWVEGYRYQNLTFAFPFMSKEMQQELIRNQKAEYGMAWFWRLGWGSGPSIGTYTIELETENSIRIIYFFIQKEKKRVMQSD